MWDSFEKNCRKPLRPTLSSSLKAMVVDVEMVDVETIDSDVLGNFQKPSEAFRRRRRKGKRKRRRERKTLFTPEEF